VAARNPVASFTVNPSEPSTSETIQLLDCSRDPGDVGIAWRAWDFGDGTTSVGPAPVHRYSAAGDYEVTLTLATFDGRVSRCSETLRVRPHHFDPRSEPDSVSAEPDSRVSGGGPNRDGSRKAWATDVERDASGPANEHRRGVIAPPGPSHA